MWDQATTKNTAISWTRERTGAACEAVRGLDGRDQLADVIVIRERVLVFGKRATFGRHIGIASS